jgi:ubiquinone biosynthesis protein
VRITGELERGELSLRIRPLADPRDVDVVTRLVSRGILAFFSASIGLVGVLLLGIGGGEEILGTHLNALLGYAGLIAATALGLRVPVAITRDAG